MFRGLYIASTGMLANTTAIDVVSNNLANASTLGYKKDFLSQESFNDVLISKLNGASLKNNSASGPIKVTEDKGNFTVETSGGYFKVKNDQGLSFNKMIKFHTDEKGYLSTNYLNDNKETIKGFGNRVQGQKGDIFVGEDSFTVDASGQILVGGQVKDKLVSSPPGNVIGTMNSGVRISQIVTSFQQGDLQTTESYTDFAILGKGFFEVDTPDGVRYTRSGSFLINSEGELVTTEGNKIVGADGPIVLESDDFSVNKFGEISVNGVIVDKFKIVNPANSQDMKKSGQSLYRLVRPSEDIPFEGSILQGSVEESNTSSINEMIEMLQLYRNYETNQKIISSYDSTMEKLLTDLGR
jgi:flagellar basal-body rod protein FlgG